MVSIIAGAVAFVLLFSPAPAKASCHKISIFIRHPAGSLLVDLGHTGISIDERYHDFGPRIDYSKDPGGTSPKKFWLYTISVPGGPFYQGKFEHDQKRRATAQDARFFLRTDGPASYEVSIDVTPEEAWRVEYYWQWLEEHYPRFHVFGPECTNIVARSLRYGGLLQKSPWIPTPMALQALLRRELRSTCGQRAGQDATITKLN